MQRSIAQDEYQNVTEYVWILGFFVNVLFWILDSPLPIFGNPFAETSSRIDASSV